MKEGNPDAGYTQMNLEDIVLSGNKASHKTTNTI